MFLSDGSLKRPVAMLCLIIALVFLGFNSYRKLGLEMVPQIDIPYITVTTVYPGANPEDIEVDVAKKIEDAVMTISGINHVNSVCMENLVQTIIEFNIGVDVDVAANDVREKIDLKLAEFPDDVEKPIILKLDINAKPIVNLALTGNMDLATLYEYADNELRDRLSTIQGVANIELLGGAKNEVHVIIDKNRLAEKNLNSVQVLSALGSGMATLPAGRIRTDKQEFSVKYYAEFNDISEIGNIQLSSKDGKRVFLKDVAKITMGSEEVRQKSFFNGEKAIAIKLVKRSDANTVEVVDSIKKSMDEIKQYLPKGMKLNWVSDRANIIRNTLNNTISNIFIGILLTALILFFFLFNPRSTIIVAITMPITIIISLFFLKLLGFTLNIMTLLAAGLSVGVLVTNSIVVMENVVDKLKHHDNPWHAAKEGTAEVAVAVMAGVGTNVVVLLPIGMMGSIIGMMFRPFAWTMLVVNAVSLFVSFTLTPIGSAFLLKKMDEDNVFHKFEQIVMKRLNAIISGYMSFITPKLSTIRGCITLIFITFIVFLSGLYLLTKTGFNFTPKMDQGEMLITMEYPTSQNLDTTIKRTEGIRKDLLEINGIDKVLITDGKIEGMLGQSSEGVNVAQIQLFFVDRDKREKETIELLDVVREKMKKYPGIISSVSIPSIMGGQELPIEMNISGPDLKRLENVARKIKGIALSIDGFKEPDITVKDGKNEIRLTPRRNIIKDIGLSVSSLGIMLRTNLEGIIGGTFKKGDRSYDIRVKMAEKKGKSQLDEYMISLPDGSKVPMIGVVDKEETTSAAKIIRVDKKRTIKLYSNLEGIALGDAVNTLKKRIDDENVLPEGYSVKFAGSYERMAEAGAEFAEAALLAILLTYLALSAILESFIKPIFIMTTLPLGLIGIAYALFLTGNSINIFVLLGAVMLIGIVVNNAVLIFERMHVLIDQGMHASKAMIQAIHDEFRPIIMITIASVLGMAPLAVATGVGSELTVGIGIASVGGVIVSGLLTLMIIPAFYELYLKITEKF